jgi:putative hydrolase of HD superfamily
MEKRILDFLEEVLRLKRTPRSGWWYYGIEEPESVADHTFGVLIWTYLLIKFLRKEGYKLNMEKALLIALFHEIGEAKLGDLHLEARKYLGENYISEAERRAVEDISSLLPGGDAEISELWNSFENRNSLEAKVVRAADKLELLFQVFLYEKSGYKNLDEIFGALENKRDFNNFPIVMKMVELIENLRKELK